MTTALAAAPLMDAAAAPHADLVRAAARTPLDAPTPCATWDLRALLGHLLAWTPVLAATGRRQAVALPDEGTDLVVGDWPATLDAARHELVAAWRDPAAWTGTVTMGGPDALPADMIGGMVLGELVVHGWDLGRSVGRTPDWPPEVLEAALTAVSGMAEQGRGMGVFADEVPLAGSASTLDRVLALSGRDPAP